MIIRNERGSIRISQDVIAGIVSECANNCFGIRGMAYTNRTDGLVHLLRRDAWRKGVRVTMTETGVDIELHIIVRHGINIAATANSIISEIRYKVEKLADVAVGTVTICVDGIMTD
ncbi:MAG: Asp23/Gls24 family envelope stress response protein [Clostridiales bacterium]|nr:Asp23/Gls24 family envelope stress response protein [Clostridiales bacterium]